MLVLAGIETIFFIVSGMGLCFGFGLKTALTIEMFLLIVSNAYTESRPFFPSLPFSPSSTVRRVGVHKHLGGDTAGAVDPN